MRFSTRRNSALHWIAMLLLAGMISEGAMAQTPPAREPVGKLELVAAIMGDQPAGIAVSGQYLPIVSFCGGLQNADNSLHHQPLSLAEVKFSLATD
jgi:hypothetical protein